MQFKRQVLMVGGPIVARARRMIMLVLVVFATGGCGDAAPPEDDAAAPRPNAARPASAAAAEPTARIIFLGDSLTAGFGVDEEEAFPALVADALEAGGRGGSGGRIVNAGVSGDTTAGGLARLEWLLKQEPDVLVVGLGGNDGLRGLDLTSTEANLRGIVERARAAGVVVVLLGMRLPPNYGPDYIERFAAIYPRLAEAYDLIHVPFLLEGVGGEPEFNLPDGIHPNAAGHAIIAQTVLPSVREALAARSAQ